jgi:hypothetical protein
LGIEGSGGAGGKEEEGADERQELVHGSVVIGKELRIKRKTRGATNEAVR